MRFLTYCVILLIPFVSTPAEARRGRGECVNCNQGGGWVVQQPRNCSTCVGGWSNSGQVTVSPPTPWGHAGETSVTSSARRPAAVLQPFTRHLPGQTDVDGIAIPKDPKIVGHKFLPSGEMHWVDAQGKKVAEVTETAAAQPEPAEVDDPNENPLVKEIAAVVFDTKKLNQLLSDKLWVKLLEGSDSLRGEVEAEKDLDAKRKLAKEGLVELKTKTKEEWLSLIGQLETRRKRTGDKRLSVVAKALTYALENPDDGYMKTFDQAIEDPLMEKPDNKPSFYCVPCKVFDEPITEGLRRQGMDEKDQSTSFNGQFAHYEGKNYRLFFDANTGRPAISEQGKSAVRELDPEKDKALLDAIDKRYADQPLNKQNTEADHQLFTRYGDWRKNPDKTTTEVARTETDEPAAQTAREATVKTVTQTTARPNYSRQGWIDMLNGGKSGTKPVKDVFDYQMGYLGLTGLVTWMGPNHHFNDNAYGLNVLWNEIDKLKTTAPARFREVMQTLREVNNESSPAAYKMEYGNDGFCLWCNLRSEPDSIKYLQDETF